MKKYFDLHIAVGYFQPLRNVFAFTTIKDILSTYVRKASTFKDALIGLITDLEVNNQFAYLEKNPHGSIYPLPTAFNTNYRIDFYLHLEYGIDVDRKIYAKTVINNFPHIEKELSFRQVSINLINFLDYMFVFKSLTRFPGWSQFPFPVAPSMTNGKSVPRAVLVEEAKPKDIKRQLPSHLTDVGYPKCKTMCTSWDNFGKSKCKNMCEWRSEI